MTGYSPAPTPLANATALVLAANTSGNVALPTFTGVGNDKMHYIFSNASTAAISVIFGDGSTTATLGIGISIAPGASFIVRKPLAITSTHVAAISSALNVLSITPCLIGPVQ